jgi:hypothetical protein
MGGIVICVALRKGRAIMEWPPKWTFACPLSADIFAKSRKSNNPKNLAKVDPWTSPLLAATPLRQ